MMEFGHRVAEGICSAGWALGFVAGLGVILLIVGLFGYALMCVFGGEETEEEHERENQ